MISKGIIIDKETDNKRDSPCAAGFSLSQRVACEANNSGKGGLSEHLSNLTVKFRLFLAVLSYPMPLIYNNLETRKQPGLSRSLSFSPSPPSLVLLFAPGCPICIQLHLCFIKPYIFTRTVHGSTSVQSRLRDIGAFTRPKQNPMGSTISFRKNRRRLLRISKPVC